MFVPLALFGGNIGKLWSIPLDYLLFLQTIAILTYAVNIFSSKVLKLHNFGKYLAIISSCMLIGIVSANGYVGIYISYGFFPFMAALYYSKKFTRIASIISFISIVLSMLYRTHQVLQCNPITGQIYTPMEYFWTFTPGFTIEIIFTHLIAMAMTTRGENNIKALFSLIDETNQMNLLLTDKNSVLEETQSRIIQFISKILGSHDLFTGNHVNHTRTYVGIIARKLKENGHYSDVLTNEEISTYETAALLHDIGKIHIPEGILNKTGKFTPEEFQIMKIHPEEGKKLLQYLPPISDGKFNCIAEDMCLYHHEKWDGSGYPFGISGTKIPLCARIMTAADVLDALLSRRLYKEPMTVDQAMHIFRDLSGIQFEPCISKAVLDSRTEITSFDSYFKGEEEQNNLSELEWWKRYHDYMNNASRQ